MSYFVFDNQSSQKFGLVIGTIGAAGVQTFDTYSDVEVIKDRSARGFESYYYGRRLPDELTIPVEIVSESGRPYQRFEERAIQEWLFGRKEAKFFSIVDPEMGNVSYLCFLKRPRVIVHAGNIAGWAFDMVCSTPAAFTDLVETPYECVNDASRIQFHNLSDMDGYLFPEMSIQMLGNSTTLMIENLTDNNRRFHLTNLRQGEQIYIDNKRQIMTSGSGANIFQHFNLNWFRFGVGFNDMLVTGRCILTFRNRFMKAIGGF